ncbi:hypothetical protein [Pollutibacter soli]|uniref:hypothetical protein n=1 Tax=Pollutibacter soli TaxID=3034157 RepID=UPI0030135AF6
MKFVSTIIVVVAICILSSCNSPRYIYGVTPQNLPALKKQGDFEIDAFYSTNGPEAYTDDIESNGYSKGFDGNAAVAITNHWAVTGSLGYRWERSIYDDYYSGSGNLTAAKVDYYRMNWEAGTGYFASIHPKNKIYFQIFGGVGGGRYSMDDLNRVDPNNPSGGLALTRFHDADVFRFYLHPAVHFHFNDYFSMAVAGKMTNVHYSNVRTDYSLLEQENYRLLALEGKTFTMFEPCIDLKFRIPEAEWISPHMQMGFSTYLSNYDTRKFNFSIGLAFLNPRKSR